MWTAWFIARKVALFLLWAYLALLVVVLVIMSGAHAADEGDRTWPHTVVIVLVALAWMWSSVRLLRRWRRRLAAHR